MQYEHIFFDLDHTLWDFETNSKEALFELADKYKLLERGVDSMDNFLVEYFIINEKLWDGYRKGTVEKFAEIYHNAVLPFQIGRAHV